MFRQTGSLSHYPKVGKSIGLDVGLKSFVVDTDGNSEENPRFVQKSADKLANIRRRLARMKIGSNNRQKIKDMIDEIQAKVNHRRDSLHELSRLYINYYDDICVEDLESRDWKRKATIKGRITISTWCIIVKVRAHAFAPGLKVPVGSW